MKKIIFLAVICLTVLSCNNDDDMDPNTCNVQGFAFTYGNESGFIPESDLSTELFPNSTPPMMEIFGFIGPDTVVFTAPLSGGISNLNINNLGNEVVSSSIQVNGTMVGDLIRLTVTGSYQGQALNAEFCVIVDSVNP